MKRTKKSISLGIALAVMATAGAIAQEQAMPSLTVSIDSRSWATLNLGVEYPLIDERLRAVMSVSLPVLMYIQGSGVDNFQVGLGLVSDWRPVEGFPAFLNFTARVTGTSQRQALGDFFGLGTSFQLNPSWDFGSFSAGPLLSWHKVWLTHITLSREMRDAFDGSSEEYTPAEGWYALGVSELQFGVALRYDTVSAGSWFLGLGPRVSIGSLAEPLEGFPMGEWPFWLELGWQKGF